MLDTSLRQIERDLDRGALVLDVGGWASPIARADWVIDRMPYETRGRYGPAPDPRRERFRAETWVQRDICDREPWPFADRQFDFAICSHTLEDVRDPVAVCGQICRVAKAGYVEVPSRLEEQSWGVAGEFVGWSHHRWLVEIAGGAIEFVAKPHAIHGNPAFFFPAELAATLSETERVQQLFWEGGFDARERIFVDADAHDAYLSEVVEAHRDRLAARARPGRLRGLRRRR